MRKKSFFIFGLALLFCSCATMKPQAVLDLEKQGIAVGQITKLPGQVIVYRENDASGFTVEYGVLRYRSAEKNVNILEYFDPEKKLVFDRNDILAYLKLDVYNPTGQMLEVSYFNDLEVAKFSGGNVPNSSFIFYVPIPKKAETVKVKVRLGLENAPTFVETKELECSFAENEKMKGGK